jgi:hypothetical protein
MMWREEHNWYVSVLQRVHLSNFVKMSLGIKELSTILTPQSKYQLNRGISAIFGTLYLSDKTYRKK